MSGVSQKLIDWWKINGRRFPWRDTFDPYRIFVAEVLLHRTKAESVAEVFEEFLDRFPDITALANSDFKDIHTVTRKLGLRWRSEMLQKAAKEMVKKFNGQVPSKRAALIELPGVGEYIASAVAIFSTGEFLPLLDTNIVRVISRYSGIPRNENSRRSEEYRSSVIGFVDPQDIRSSYFSIIDLGALVCKASAPICQICPIKEKCDYASDE